MEVIVLGTGAADGWPNPWCCCRSCVWARDAGVLRTHTSALIDRSLLIDCGPDVPRQADRAGVGLSSVRTLLLTHAHPDHVAPAALLWRSWAASTEPLQILGPASTLDACRDWIGPGDPITLTPLAADDEVVLGDHVVRALAADHTGTHGDELAADALLYDVEATAGGRLFYATDTGPLPAESLTAIAARAYDIVLLELTFGDVHDHGTGHLDSHTFPLALADLRSVGAVVDTTDVVAVHLGHHNPPGPELERRLQHWGARTVQDLTTLGVRVARQKQPPRRQLVLGGARSGKSAEAERRLAAHPAVTYIATGGQRDGDTEWAARVATHRARRPSTWTTVEYDTPQGVIAFLEKLTRSDVVLVDCVSLWLAAALDATGIWEVNEASGGREDALKVVRAHCDALVEAVRQCQGMLVLVSNEVGGGVVPEHASGRLYRDLLGTLNSRLAAVCDDADLVVAGRVLSL